MRVFILCFAFAYLLVSSAWSDTAPAGVVKTMSGEVLVTTAGTSVRATVGTPVYSGSELKTGNKSSLGIVFNDATVMSFGSDTTVNIDDYLYAPNASQHKFASKLVKGSLGYLSGAIAKLNPQAVRLQTNTGTLGVRGTHLLAVDNGVQSFVTLIADPDGKVGQVIVEGARGSHLLQRANTSVPLDGSSYPYASDPLAIQQQFSEVLNALPVQPPLPSLGQGALAPAGPVAPVGAGAPTGVAAAVGGIGTSAVGIGAIAAGLFLSGGNGSSGTTGTR